MPTPLTVAVSPCPNDTIIFAAWALGLVPEIAGVSVRFLWEDVQTLNDWAAGRDPAGVRPDVIKLSAAAALALPDHVILDAGAAFGLGCGPKLVARPDSGWERFVEPVVAVPGLATTAAALTRLALGRAGRPYRPLPLPYDRVKDAVLSGQADAGVLIHETALVWERHGLALVLDLGKWWDEHTEGLPLPLGVIAARREIGETLIAAVDAQIRESLAAAQADRAKVWPLVRALAQELDDATLEAHIQAYVSPLSRSMGDAGRRALAALADRL